MRSEKEKMLAGDRYDPLDPILAQERSRSRLLIEQLNRSSESDVEERSRIIRSLLPNADPEIWLQPPFYCDYGYNIIIGEKVFLNFNCVILDVTQVKIGGRTLIGPDVQIYTATHPIVHTQRAEGIEFAKPITIGEDVWIGGGVIICPGVSIGDRTVIGAGSVVTKDIPSDVMAAGNPCKVIRRNAKKKA